MRLLLLLISTLLILGCIQPNVVYKYKYIKVTKPPKPAALNLQIPHFYVVSPVNREEFMLRIEAETNGVFFAITPDDYEIIAHNIQEFRRYMRQQKAITVYYESLLSADQQE